MFASFIYFFKIAFRKRLNVSLNLSQVVVLRICYFPLEKLLLCVFLLKGIFSWKRKGPLIVLLKFIVLKYTSNNCTSKILVPRYSWLSCYRIEKQISYPPEQAHLQMSSFC